MTNRSDPIPSELDRISRTAALATRATVAIVTVTDAGRLRLVGSWGLEGAGENAPTSRSLAAVLEPVMKSGKPLSVGNVPSRSKHGGPVQIAGLDLHGCLGAPLRARDGSALGVLAVLDVEERAWDETDVQVVSELAALAAGVVERRAAEGEHYEKTRQSLFNSLTDLVCIVDPEGRFIDANDAVIQRYGYPLDELVGATLSILGAPDRVDLEDALARVRLAAAGEPQRFEFWARTREGEIFPNDVMLTPGLHRGKPVAIAVGRDLSEQKAAELALRESESLFRQLAENVAGVFWMYDFDSERTVYVSPRIEAIWGMRPDEFYVSSRAWLESVHPDDVERVVAAIDAAREENYEIEYRILRADGDVRWIRDRSQAIRNADGMVYRSAGIADDITEWKTMEQERTEADTRYRRLVETSPYGIYAIDLEGRFIEVNDAAAEILGVPAHELLGRHIGTVLAPEDLDQANAERETKISGRKHFSDHVMTAIRPSGERRLVHIRSALIGSPDVPLGTHGIARDITEERERERERETEIRLLATALETIDTAVSISTPDGTFVYTNAAHKRILGYDAVEGRTPHRTAFAPNEEGVKKDEEIVRSVLESGTWSGRVQRRRRDDGRVVPVEMVLGRLDQEAGGPLLFDFARDVSEVLEQERQFRRIERLASVGTMIGGIAHELNNPLHAVRNFADLMLMEERNELDREALEIIRREADRAAKVIADLRLFARHGQEENTLRDEVDLNQLVRNVIGLRRYAMETRSIEILEDLDAALPLVIVNRAEMEQMIFHLVVNAEQAMAPQSENKRLFVSTRATASGVCIEVRDSGPGIPADTLEQIFDPFFTTRDPGEGAGLGLALVHSIVHEHGGTIRVNSELGSGTTLAVDLPRPSTAVAAPQADSPAPMRSGPLRLLFVDDEDSLRRSAMRYFTKIGHDVRLAADGEEALRLLDEHDIDVIVSDLRMPGMDGEVLLQRLRDGGQGLERRVVFVTGDANSRIAGILASAGCPVLYKPVQLSAIAEVIDRLVDGPEITGGE